MTKTLLSSTVETPKRPLAGWRPALLLTLGLLPSLPLLAQQRPLIKQAEAATPVMLPQPATARPAATPAAPRTVRRVMAAVASTATGGNWSDPTSWVGGAVPTATDDVTIVSGATVTLDVMASAASLTVATGGSLLNSATTGYTLAVGGSVTNNGILDLSFDSAIGSDLRFTGAGNATFGGTGTTDLQTVTLAKAVKADVVEMNLPTLSVKGSTTSGDGFLVMRTTGATPADDMTGTLKVSGSATISSKVFGNTAAYVVPATGGFWLNNPNFTVAAQMGTATVNGLLRLSAGTYNVGTAAGNSLTLGSGSVLTVEGGVLSAAGRVTSFTSATAAAATTFTLSGGTINVATVGNTSGTPSFGTNGTTNISGGVINLVQRSTATTPLDYYVAGTYNFTGGTVNIGTATTATNFDFRIRGTFPNLTVDNTTNPKTALMAGQTNVYGTALITPGATLNLNGYLLLQLGPAITNDGTFTATTTGSRLYFQGNAAQSIGGTGTFTGAIVQMTFQNSGPGVSINAPLIVRNVAMFRGNVLGSGNLTLQSSSTSLAVISYGLTNPTASGGNFDVAPTFDVSAGGLYLIYNPELVARTTGFEIPGTRSILYMDMNNPKGVTLAGGDLTVTGDADSFALAGGVFTTSADNKLIIGKAGTTLPTGSATSYVNGPLGITVNSTTAVNRTFAVGDAAGWRPVVVTGITAATDQIFTATVVKAATGGTLSGGLSGLNPTRYVRLQNSAALPATARVQLSYGADDVLGAPATAVVAQSATAGGSYASLGGAAATVPTTGIISTQDLTPGNDFFALANTEGGTLISSVAAVCAGTNTGTITLAGNTGTVTGYEADSGSGFVAVAGTNTGATYTFTDLAVTTTFRAVLTTADGRTFYSAPVTVVVNPATTATFTYASATFCQSGTNATPTITGTAGGTFSSTTGLSINATTGVINLAASTTGSYVVTYTVAGTCASSATFNVAITAPATAGFSYASANYCTSTTGTVTPALTSGATAGTFSSTTGLTINATTGAITPGTSAPGTYVVTNMVAASGACAAVTATFSVTINALPAQPTVKVQYNGPVTTLTSSAATGNQWFLNGTAIAGATNPTYVVNSAAQLGSYTVVTTSAAGCASLPSAPLVVTSTNKALAGTSLQLYPNPTTSGLLTVKLGGYNKAVELTVYNSVGQQVRTISVPAGRLEQPLDLSQLSSGVYILKARTEGGLDVRRIVKE